MNRQWGLLTDKRYCRSALIVLLCISVSACKGLESLLPRYSDNRIELLHLIATDDVNQSTPVAIDIVYIFEEALVPQLSAYTARKWFDEKRQFQLQYPDKFVVFSYELVPVSQATLRPEKEKKKFPKAYQKAFKVMAYANYLAESNDYTLDITPFKRPTISLGNNKISISEGGSS
jgi:type VI secretion system protein